MHDESYGYHVTFFSFSLENNLNIYFKNGIFSNTFSS